LTNEENLEREAVPEATGMLNGVALPKGVALKGTI